MSIQAMSWALKQQEVADAPARHVLLCLANYAGEGGKAAFPSVPTLALDTGLSERTVRSKLDLLEAKGLIKYGNQAIVAAYIPRADRRPVVYDLSTERGAAPAPRSRTGCSSRRNGVQLTASRGAAPAPNTRALTINDPRAVNKLTTAKDRSEAERLGLQSVGRLLAGQES